MAQVRSREHAALGRALRAAREQSGLSQEELGFRSGLHRNYVGGCERGEINLSFDILLRLARGLSVPLSDLIARFEHQVQEANGDATTS